VCARYFELCAAWRRLLCVASTAPQTSVQRIRRTDGACELWTECGLLRAWAACDLHYLRVRGPIVDLSVQVPAAGCRVPREYI